MGDIYQVLTLSLVIGKASSRIASVTEFVLHVTRYIPLLATVLKIIHLWYKTRPYSNCLRSIHLMDNLQLRSLRENFLLGKKKRMICSLSTFSLCFSVVLFLLDNTGHKRKTKENKTKIPENCDTSGINFVWKFPPLLTSLHDNESP